MSHQILLQTLYLNALHCVDAGVMLNFQLSHGDNNTAFKNMLEEFLSLAVILKRKKTEDSFLSVKLNSQRNKMLNALARGQKVCNIDDIKKYFTLKFVIKAFDAYQDRIIWDVETKAIMSSNEESDQPYMPPCGSVARQLSHFTHDADKSVVVARDPTLRTPTSRNVNYEPSTTDGETGVPTPLLSTPTAHDVHDQLATSVEAARPHSASETSPQHSPATKQKLKTKPSGDQGAYL